ncbi:hypothetical protein VNI00_015257 [Paramarasmius palmivorus]|uniref:Uncharacterized protein n=1 Tax=Paramarasmius palmivorus TaxID=297713 RepID=A0AAW0BMF2_9AGAR
MEFFNRVVDAYPRGSDGKLSTQRKVIDPEGTRLELSMLRSFADFPISFQKMFPTVPLLTSKFRNNVCLVDSALQESDVGAMSSSETLSFVDCPGGDAAPVRDMSSVSVDLLWAVEVVRLEGYILCSEDFGGDSSDCSSYDACSYRWLRGALVDLLGVEMVAGGELYKRAHEAVEVVLALVEPRK